jgi:K+-transporting ATPase ATPase B chain
VIISLKAFGGYFHLDFSYSMLVAFLICLIPTTISSLLSAIGIAGVNRLLRYNVLAMSGQAIEAAGDIDIIMIDKTGTITLGNRRAAKFIPDKGIFEEDLIKAAYLTSVFDETTEGKSIVELALLELASLKKLSTSKLTFIPFSASTRISGVDFDKSSFRKGAKDTIEKFCKKSLSSYLQSEMDKVAREGSTPLLVCSKNHILGIVELKDILKPGLAEQFHRFDLMGQKTVMVTGDNQITAAAIAKEAGLSDFLAEASPEDKLHYLQRMQARGFMVAMTGDGVNDAPALAYANVGVAMNAGTEAAKEAGNMIDLDSSPSKLLSIIEIGKQLLITRGALTTFSTANDVAKYFTVLPAMLMPFFPFFHAMNVMNLSTPQRAILSVVIFNALIIVALIPLAFKGVKFVPQKAAKLLKKNLLVYGVGGVILPFLGIKTLDMLLTFLGVL